MCPPPWSHTATGRLESGLVPRSLATRRLRQSSLMLVTREVKGSTSPVPWGHHAPGVVASMTEPRGGETGTGGAKRLGPEVSSA